MRIIHAVPFGEDFARLIAGANGGNVSVGQSKVPMFRPSVSSVLLRRISVIFGFSTNPQMSRINAWGVIANVHNYFISGNRPNVKLIRVPMGANRFFAGKKKDAVAILVARSLPFPTTVAFLKALLKNIVRGKQRVFVQLISGFGSRVTPPAQFSANSFFGSTLNTRKRDTRLVSHNFLLSPNLMTLTR